MIKTVGIVGFGALGVLYASEFQKVLGRENVWIIADQIRIDRYVRGGVKVNGMQGSFCYVTPQEARPVDLLIFAVKYQGLEQAARAAEKAVDDHTIVMSFLNGVVSEQMLEKLLPCGHLLYTTVQGMDATRTGNDVYYTQAGSVIFGQKDGGRSEEVLAVDAFFSQAGIAHRISDDMVHQLYSKWMLNVGVNQACAVYGATYGGVQVEGPARTVMITAMEEARSVAAAEGICLSEEERDNWISLINTLSPDGEPSMKQDVRAGRPTEVELFAALVCKLGHRHDIAVPQNETFCRILTQRNEALAQEGK